MPRLKRNDETSDVTKQELPRLGGYGALQNAASGLQRF